MMFIEHTSLEDNLQHILRNHVPAASATATASVLLAHVREAEEAATHLQLQAQTAYSIDLRAEEGENLRFANAHRDFQHELKTLRNSPEFIAAANNGQQHNPQSVEIEEEEEEEHFELFEVVDTDSEQQTHPEETQTPANDLIFQFEEEEVQEQEKDFEYILTKVPINKRAPKSVRSLPALNSYQPRRPIARRPIPDAIPIRVLNNNQLAGIRRKVFPTKTKSVEKRILNGNLPQLKRCDSQNSIYSSASSATRYSYVCENDSYLQNGGGDFFIASDELERNVQYEDDEEQERARYTQPPQEYAEVNYRRESSQMGIDIFTKLRRLLHLTPSSNYNTQDGKRKRRKSQDWTAANPHKIKYRKVDNRFPKFITHPLDDDDLELISPFPNTQEKQNLLQKQQRSASKKLLEMSQRRSLHSIEKPNLRKSIFTAPQTTHKLVKNTTYADVEFSDDDEPELIKGFGIGTGGNASGMPQQQQQQTSSRIFNIPISHRSEERLKFSTAAKPPPPLIEARTGNIMVSSLVPELNTLRKPTYADALRQNNRTTSDAVKHVFGGGGRAASSISSSAASARVFNGFGSSIGTNPWCTNARSILAQEKESDERDKYQQLLEQVVPRLYGNENTMPQLSKNAFPTLGLARRRSAQMITAATSSTARNSPISTNRQSLTLQRDSLLSSLKRPPLSSTINLDDDENDGSQMRRRSSATKTGTTTVIIDDDDISDIIDLGYEERNVLSACDKLKDREPSSISLDTNLNKKKNEELPYVEPINTLQERFNSSPHLKDSWLADWQFKWSQKKQHRQQEVTETVKFAEKVSAERRAVENEIHERLRKFQIIDPDLLVLDDFPEPEEEADVTALTDEQQTRLKAIVRGPLDQVLVSKFNLNITRRDIHTLLGNNWLNDEVINFYMNLLTERGEKMHESHGLPRVYAMNTFFVPRLMQAGHGGVKRWTRKVDIFAKDVIPVPVHVGGVHWCMAIIHLKNRSIKYYDSMGTPNPNVLKALEQYLKDESMDKRKQPFDTSQFEVESVRDVPRQMNGSDCGVFSCMFAEYISRNREITFSQQNMEFFRDKMILEIVQGELMH